MRGTWSTVVTCTLFQKGSRHKHTHTLILHWTFSFGCTVGRRRIISVSLNGFCRLDFGRQWILSSFPRMKRIQIVQEIHIQLNINNRLWAPATKPPSGTLFWLHKHDGDRYDCFYLPFKFSLFISLPICLLCQYQPPQADVWEHVARLIISTHQLFPSSL